MTAPRWLAGRSVTTRLTLALALLLLGFAALVALLGRHVASEHEQESLQRLSHGLAQHIVEHWPAITRPDPDQAEQAARAALLTMLMVVNPGVQVYVLDADGRVAAYIGEPGMVRQEQVDLQPVREFLGGAALPLRGTDPMGGSVLRIFSAAMFAPRAGDTRPPGYLYVVLDGQVREQIAGQLSLRRVWLGAGLIAALVLMALLVVATLARRLQATAQREQRQVAAHREMMASVAHDLRTPLTALHGHLEALGAGLEKPAATQPIGQADSAGLPALGVSAGPPALAVTAGPPGLAVTAGPPGLAVTAGLPGLAVTAGPPGLAITAGLPARLVAAALAQSNKVRRLSQQLFELAALQSTDQVLHRERFRLDELVTDAVQKFDLSDGPPAVTLGGDAPGRLELDGDLQLIERALTNLIDNAMRHAPGAAPVRVSLRRDGAQAQILVEDSGPGLPAELMHRLLLGQSLREPPLKRPGGGIGGLGLAIAQRVAILHGGSLRPLPAAHGGTRLCLVLPLAV